MGIGPSITDGFGRRFPYLRLSVTDVCNFRCTYCLPDGYQKTDCDPFLSPDEIERLVKAFASLGVWKIRLTGGEPTVRSDFLEIARRVSGTMGIRKLVMTTNGYRLPQRARSYFDAGIRGINISIDSLDPRKFHEITGHDRLGEVLEGMQACFDVGFEAVKINAVLLKGQNDDELDKMISFVMDKPVSLRFIELMRTRDNQEYFMIRHFPGSSVVERLERMGWEMAPRTEGAGPAVEFTHPDSKGTVGLIAPYSKDFCKTCNRLRVSAKGALHLCLFGEGGYSLRDFLQSDDQQEELKEKVLGLMNYKQSGHFLHQNNSGATPHLASIGG